MGGSNREAKKRTEDVITAVVVLQDGVNVVEIGQMIKAALLVSPNVKSVAIYSNRSPDPLRPIRIKEISSNH